MVITWCVAAAAGRVSDVTARYAYRWCTHTQKLRVDSAWWSQSLRRYSPSSEEVEEEQNNIRGTGRQHDGVCLHCIAQVMSYPLPVSIQDYKNHPL